MFLPYNIIINKQEAVEQTTSDLQLDFDWIKLLANCNLPWFQHLTNTCQCLEVICNPELKVRQIILVLIGGQRLSLDLQHPIVSQVITHLSQDVNLSTDEQGSLVFHDSIIPLTIKSYGTVILGGSLLQMDQHMLEQWTNFYMVYYRGQCLTTNLALLRQQFEIFEQCLPLSDRFGFEVYFDANQILCLRSLIEGKVIKTVAMPSLQEATLKDDLVALRLVISSLTLHTLDFVYLPAQNSPMTGPDMIYQLFNNKLNVRLINSSSCYQMFLEYYQQLPLLVTDQRYQTITQDHPEGIWLLNALTKTVGWQYRDKLFESNSIELLAQQIRSYFCMTSSLETLVQLQVNMQQAAPDMEIMHCLDELMQKMKHKIKSN